LLNQRYYFILFKPVFGRDPSSVNSVRVGLYAVSFLIKEKGKDAASIPHAVARIIGFLDYYLGKKSVQKINRRLIVCKKN
jgi:hypothetical protein